MRLPLTSRRSLPLNLHRRVWEADHMTVNLAGVLEQQDHHLERGIQCQWGAVPDGFGQQHGLAWLQSKDPELLKRRQAARISGMAGRRDIHQAVAARWDE